MATAKPKKRAPAPVEATLRRVLGGAAALSAAGAFVSGTVSRNVGAALLVVGWVAFVFALHRYGRLGADGAG